MDSNIKSFRLSGVRTIFPTEEEALANQRAFHDHVEDVVRNGRPPMIPAVTVLPAKAAKTDVPKQLQAALRGTRAMHLRVRLRSTRMKCKSRYKQKV